MKNKYQILINNQDGGGELLLRQLDKIGEVISNWKNDDEGGKDIVHLNLNFAKKWPSKLMQQHQ
jgi:hypothetical protein